MSILHYNGGTVVGMAGKDCVGIACDKRIGAQYCTLDTNFSKIYEIEQNIYLGCAGLATDAHTVSQRLKFRKNMFELRENRKVTPKIFASMLSNILYEKRFGPYYTEPIVAAMDENGKPFLCFTDLIGCLAVVDHFVCTGNAAEQTMGICEALWEPDLEADALLETLSQSLINAMERDAGTGHGALVYIIEKDKVTISEIKTRMD